MVFLLAFSDRRYSRRGLDPSGNSKALTSAIQKNQGRRSISTFPPLETSLCRRCKCLYLSSLQHPTKSFSDSTIRPDLQSLGTKTRQNPVAWNQMDILNGHPSLWRPPYCRGLRPQAMLV
jgi:hypothetical protein